jgi:hypothetical protein
VAFFGNTDVYYPSDIDIDIDGEVSVLDFSKWAKNFGTDNIVSGIMKPKYLSQVPVIKKD